MLLRMLLLLIIIITIMIMNMSITVIISSMIIITTMIISMMIMHDYHLYYYDDCYCCLLLWLLLLSLVLLLVLSLSLDAGWVLREVPLLQRDGSRPRAYVRTANLPTKIVPTKIPWLQLSGKFPMDVRTANLRTNIMDFRGFDSSIILSLRVEFPGPRGISRKVWVKQS